jgi:stage V sporulation protein D (sporulation-specific penicillin-binding protein)
MSYALENSLNLGMVFIQRKLGREAFVSGILDQFQIGGKTEIDLPGEVNNKVGNLTKDSRDSREINYANVSYGQGIAITPLRMMTSFNSIINGGKIVKPRIVKAIQNPDGDVKTFEPEIQGQSMSEDKARVLSEMLVDVVNKGSGKGAAIEGYSIGGKTGTGQIPVNGKYIKSGGPTYQSFIEFATLDNPQYTLLISLDSPEGARFSDSSVVPKVKKLNEFLINYFLIQPDKPI